MSTFYKDGIYAGETLGLIDEKLSVYNYVANIL